MAKKTPFTVHTTKEGVETIYVKTKNCGIHFMALCYDGIGSTYFEEDFIKGKPNFSKGHITVEDALAWFEKEIKLAPDYKPYQEAVEGYTAVLAKFKAGECVENNPAPKS